MASGSCLNCGKPLYPGGQFCGFCAAPVPPPPDSGGESDPGHGSSTSGMGAEVAPEAFGSPFAAGAVQGPGAGTQATAHALGIDRTTNLVVQERSRIGPGRFVVMDAVRAPLFTRVNESPGPAVALSIGRRPVPRPTWLGPSGGNPAHVQPWGLVDRQNGQQGTLEVERARFSLFSTLIDSSNTPLLPLSLPPRGFGGFTAAVALPAGGVLLTAAGKTCHGEQTILSRSGETVARVHRPSISLGDTLFVDLLGGSEPLSPVLLGFLIDRESHGEHAAGHPPVHPGPAGHRR